MPIPTRSASLREPRKQTSNIARPTTKPLPTAGRETTENEKSRSSSNSSLVEAPKDNGARGRTQLPQRNTLTDRPTGQRLQPSKLPRGDPSPTRRDRSPDKKMGRPDSSAAKPTTLLNRRQSLMRPALKTPAKPIIPPKSSATPPSPRKPPVRAPVQPPPSRRPPSPKKTDMPPPPRPTRSSSLRQPVSATQPRPTKSSKPPTPVADAIDTGNLLIPASWPDITALQTELLQLSLFHSSSLQRQAEWMSASETHLRKKYDEVAGQYRSLIADETRRQCELNAQALGLWLSSCQEHHGPHDFSEQIQILSQVIQDVSDMVAAEGSGKYSCAVKSFEDWIDHAEFIRQNREVNKSDAGVFIDPLPRSWKESLRELNLKLELCTRHLQTLDILGFGHVEQLEGAALTRVILNLGELIQLMTQEIRVIRTLEAEVVRSERDSVSLLATQLAGSPREMRAPRVGVWRS
ncbi:uncharacterized protein N7446_005497 [Penicillium canescens]|uniref:uncharacterized protein n=1 Tax=Penicillium canescens TaxID=5083 RepID=UPI0026DFC1C0|nr:uncharacterized protein N7446_005497 [Penicillium canescens]KAJ6061377.1 hypothetical protein N7446_005497 [Penicillium canescens]KAJ6183487.1 hypothetical protein N7485_002129 [Penicillium canescens]